MVYRTLNDMGVVSTADLAHLFPEALAHALRKSKGQDRSANTTVPMDTTAIPQVGGLHHRCTRAA